MPRFLSPEWLDDLAAAAAGAIGPDGSPFTVQQVVTDGDDPGAAVSWAITFGEGRVRVEPGRHADPTITFTQDHDTASAIHRGDLSAQGAFMTGRLRVGGDVQVLLDRHADLAALDDVFGPVRLATSY